MFFANRLVYVCYLLNSLYTIVVQKEIQDRQNFLEEMISLGQGDKYRPIISTEISQVRVVNFTANLIYKNGLLSLRLIEQ